MTLDVLNPKSGFDSVSCQVSSHSDQKFSFNRANVVHTHPTHPDIHRQTYTPTQSWQSDRNIGAAVRRSRRRQLMDTAA